MTTGKWCEPDVPHRGWTCIDIEDLGEPSATCEMCEVQEIRYVHSMEHPDYPDVLRCGCICAGNMEEDLVAARRRETTVKQSAARARRWLDREWRYSAKGNPYLIVRGFDIVIYQTPDGWWARVTRRMTGHGLKSGRPRTSENEAKLAALRMLNRLMEEREKAGPTANPF